MSGLLIGDVLRSCLQRVPNRPAVSYEGKTLTYSDVADRATRIAAVLSKRGVTRGARLVWWADNTIDAIPLYFALGILGAVLVPLNPSFSKHEAGPIIDLADPAMVLVDDAHTGDLTMAEVLGSKVQQGFEAPEVHETDPHIIFWTSGTTGLPKGVVISHRADLLRSGLKRNVMWPQGATIIMFPQFHMAGWLDPLAGWMAGEEVVYVGGGDAEALLTAIEQHEGARLYCIPAVWRRLIDADPARFRTSTLRQADTGTSAISIDLLQRIRTAFPGTTTSVTYGSTEAGIVTQLWPEDVLRKPGSVGPPAPGVQIRLDNQELLVRSPWLMSGYFRDPEATAAVLAEGWYRTGEFAEIDPEGHCRIIGRVKDTIRTAGETVSPAEVDQVIQDHPDVLDAALAGIPNEEWGEIITAFVVLRPGASLDVSELRSFCAGRLARYKHPRRIVVVESIPRTPTTGQVQRRLLVEIAMDRQGRDAS